MAMPRVSASLGRTVLRRAATQSRTQAWRQAARRHASTGTASGEKAKKTSDIPWIIGSVGFTVPAAVWLYGQGPTKSDHHGEAHEVEEESKDEGAEEEQPAEGSDEEKSDDKSEDKPDEKSEESTEDKSGKDDEKAPESDDKQSDDSESGDSDDGKEKSTPETSDDEEGEDKPSAGSPGQMNYKSSMAKGPGEGQKGERKPSERKGEKDSASNKSGAQNPYLDDDEKSKKGEGVKETQKIHGTVDSNRPLR